MAKDLERDLYRNYKVRNKKTDLESIVIFIRGGLLWQSFYIYCISIPDMLKSNEHRVLSGIPNLMGESDIAIPNVFKNKYIQ